VTFQIIKNKKINNYVDLSTQIRLKTDLLRQNADCLCCYNPRDSATVETQSPAPGLGPSPISDWAQNGLRAALRRRTWYPTGH